MSATDINRDTVSGEALFILKSLRENGRSGRSNKLADVKATLEPAVSLEFDSYFFFLRKFDYIAMDREAQLRLTAEGERVAEGNALDAFTEAVENFFQDQLASADSPSGVVEVDDGNDAFEHTPVPSDSPFPPEERTSAGFPHTSMRGRSGEEDSVSDVPVPPGPPAISRAERGSDRSSDRTGPITGIERVPDKGVEIDSRYTRFEAIGAGPIGTVFRGRHNALGCEVAVKELKDIFSYFSFLQRSEVGKRLKRELTAQAQVVHPSVLRILDQNTDVSRPYFITDLMTGSARGQLEAAGGKGLPVDRALRWFVQLAYGLKAAHAAGLFHHNLKPENVVLDAYGNAKLSDFGLARVIEVDVSKGMPQVFVGTGNMAYLAPELIQRQKDAGAAADVYALGIVLYELLTGQVPGRRSPLPSEVNPDIPTKLDPIFDKMTHDRRDQRYTDIDALFGDFYAAFSEGELLHRGDLVLWGEKKG